jgi:putative heme-binding domain-containing protein
MVALGFIADQQAVDAMKELMASDVAGVQDQATWWLRYRQSNTWRNFDMPSSVLMAEVNPELQKRMLDLKAKLRDEGLSMEERVRAATAMARDKTGGEMLIGLAAEKKLPREVMRQVGQVIFDNPDQSVRVLAGDYFVKPGVTKAVSIGRIRDIAGDAAKGKALFQSKCTTCHRIGKEGATIGPDLTMIGKKFDKSGLLDAIVNPSAGMSFGYEMWLITQKDGTTVSGFLQGDAEMVVLRGMDGRIYNIKSEDIASRKQFGTSIMPPPAGLGLGEEDLADLAAYLLNGTVN